MPIPSGRDQRRFERFSVAMEVTLTYPDGESHQCTTRNISEGGMFVLLEEAKHPALGEMLTVEKIPGQSTDVEIPHNTSVVVHKDENGMGLAFVDLDLGMDF